MCGIFCKLNNDNSASLQNTQLGGKLLELLSCRGPDINNTSCCTLGNTKIYMFGTTLWMQGSEPCQQPMNNDLGSFLFNGDEYGEHGKISDTEDIFSKLTSNVSSEQDVNCIREMMGPFSLIYLNKRLNKLYFCRDRYGRKSLLISIRENEIEISSVFDRSYENCIEVPTHSIFCLDVLDFSLTEYAWVEQAQKASSLSSLFTELSVSSENRFEHTLDGVESEIDLLYKDVEEMAHQIKCRKEFLRKLLTINYFADIVNKLIELLSRSVQVRVAKQPPFCKRCIKTATPCGRHCRVAVLFSGGLDCTILAALAHKFTPPNEPIDLLNVAFEHKSCKDYSVPDRITSLQSLKELQTLYPTREWILVQMNITSRELSTKQSEIISDLVLPLQTVLDESLGSALWFAARGKTEGYESTARVVLMGMGADELFGGYTRHRNAFRRGGWDGLHRELSLDWERLPTRNLARDDRVVSHHGRQPRTPYLDEHFLQYVLRLKPWERCFPSPCCEVGVGDKLLLRLVAIKIGLENASTLPKRALQFGSKIANKKENAKDISSRLRTS